MKSSICRLFKTKPTSNPQRQTRSSAYSHLTETQNAHEKSAETGIRALESNIAYHVLDEMSHWDVVSATTTITRFVRQHRHKEAIYIFSRMLLFGIRPNEFTFGTVIPSSTALRCLSSGKHFHACAKKMGFHSNVFVGSAILDLYAKLSTIEEAQRAFEETHEPNVVSYTTLICGYLKKERFDDAVGLFKAMPERNVVSWNAMIGGYSQMGHNEDAVNLFVGMLREGFVPDHSTFPCAISAAANIAVLGMGRSFHAAAIKFLGSNRSLFVANSLISFYAKCGSMEDSLLIFSKLPEINIVSWNALICGYAQNGRGKDALDFFQKMENMGFEPNSVTLLGVLLACNHVGLVNEGYSYFNRAKLKNPDILKPEHYACMVDLLSRSGHLNEAERFICDLPFDPGIGFWKSLLGGCQIHSNTDLGEFAARKILGLDPGDVSSYVMLSNAHSAAGKWQSVSMVRQEMREKGMQRVPGCSWIEIKNHTHVFVMADGRQSGRDEIYKVLQFFLEHVTERQASEFFTEPYIQLYDHSFL